MPMSANQCVPSNVTSNGTSTAVALGPASGNATVRGPPGAAPLRRSALSHATGFGVRSIGSRPHHDRNGLASSTRSRFPLRVRSVVVHPGARSRPAHRNAGTNAATLGTGGREVLTTSTGASGDVARNASSGSFAAKCSRHRLIAVVE